MGSSENQPEHVRPMGRAHRIDRHVMAGLVRGVDWSKVLLHVPAERILDKLIAHWPPRGEIS